MVMLYVRYPLSLRNVEDRAHERGIDICHETVRTWVNRFGPRFASEIRRKRVVNMRQYTHWRWHLDEGYVRVQDETRCLWRAVDHRGEVLESSVTREWDKAAALKFLRQLMERHGSAKVVTPDGLRSYKAAMKDLGIAERQEGGRWADNRGGELTPALPTTRTGHAAVQANEDASAVRFRPRLLPQPLQPGTPPHQPTHLQGPTFSRPGRVAGSRELDACRVRAGCAVPETSCAWTDSLLGRGRSHARAGASPRGPLLRLQSPAVSYEHKSNLQGRSKLQGTQSAGGRVARRTPTTKSETLHIPASA